MYGPVAVSNRLYLPTASWRCSEVLAGGGVTSFCRLARLGLTADQPMPSGQSDDRRSYATVSDHKKKSVEDDVSVTRAP